MDKTRAIDIHAAPSPLPPTEAELAAWHALTREEQIARYRDALAHPDRQRISDATVTDVLIKMRRHAATGRNG